MVVAGPNAIAISRKLMGKTFGYDAEPGTIRGDFGASRTYNLIHGSDSPVAQLWRTGSSSWALVQICA